MSTRLAFVIWRSIREPAESRCRTAVTRTQLRPLEAEIVTSITQIRNRGMTTSRYTSQVPDDTAMASRLDSCGLHFFLIPAGRVGSLQLLLRGFQVRTYGGIAQKL